MMYHTKPNIKPKYKNYDIWYPIKNIYKNIFRVFKDRRLLTWSNVFIVVLNTSYIFVSYKMFNSLIQDSILLHVGTNYQVKTTTIWLPVKTEVFQTPTPTPIPDPHLVLSSLSCYVTVYHTSEHGSHDPLFISLTFFTNPLIFINYNNSGGPWSSFTNKQQHIFCYNAFSQLIRLINLTQYPQTKIFESN